MRKGKADAESELASTEAALRATTTQEFWVGAIISLRMVWHSCTTHENETQGSAGARQLSWTAGWKDGLIA